MTTKLGAAFRAARDEAGLTQKQLAGVLGVHHNAVLRWETGVGKPSKRSRAAVLSVLGRLRPATGEALRRAFLEAFPPKGRRGVAAVAAPVAAAPPVVHDPRRWVDTGVFRAADHLDVSPRRARGAVLRFLRNMKAGGVTVDTAIGILERPDREEEGVGP